MDEQERKNIAFDKANEILEDIKFLEEGTVNKGAKTLVTYIPVSLIIALTTFLGLLVLLLSVLSFSTKSTDNYCNQTQLLPLAVNSESPKSSLPIEHQDSSREYDLKLMSLSSADNLPSKGRNLFIVARIGDSYHVRIFGNTQKMVIDKELDESLFDKMLVQQIDTAIKSKSISNKTKSAIMGNITSNLCHIYFK